MIKQYFGPPEVRRAEYEKFLASGHRALAIMETQLTQTPCLVGTGLTIADISVYGYTHVADEDGFDLSGYPAIQVWLDRIAAHPGYVGMV